MPKYGAFQYGEEPYGKTVNAGEAVLTPSGELLSSIVDFVINVGQGIVSPITMFAHSISISFSVGGGVVSSIGKIGRTFSVYVGLAGTVVTKYGEFKYGEEKYASDLQTPLSTFSRQISIYRDVGEGIVASTARAVRNFTATVGQGVVTIVGFLETILWAWLRVDIKGKLSKKDDIYFCGEVNKEEDFEGGIEK